MEVLSSPSSVRELFARVQSGKPWLRLGYQSEKERLLVSLSQAPVTINILRGPELVFELVHPQTIRSLGERHIVGKPLLEAIPELRDQQIPELVRKVLETGERVDAKERLIRLDVDGSGQLQDTYWDFSYLPLRDARGGIEGVMTFDVNVTEQVLARRAAADRDDAIRRLMSRVDAGVAQADMEGRIVLANARCRTIFGRSEAELNRTRIDELVSDERSDNTDKFRELIEIGTSFATTARRTQPRRIGRLAPQQRLEDRELAGRPRGLVAVTLESAT
jgi:PAS domain S-box-containing protein